jgi:transcriptional regulator with XRE-family HTH domain
MKTNNDYWQETLTRYRISRFLRDYRKSNKLTYTGLAEILKTTRQYIYSIEEITLKPSDDFIQRLKQIGGEQ